MKSATAASADVDRRQGDPPARGEESSGARTLVKRADPLNPSAASASAAKLVAKFGPWLEGLRIELHEIACDSLQLHHGRDPRADSGASSDDQAEPKNQSTSPSSSIEEVQRATFKLGQLLKLLLEEILPRLPNHPDALFLAAAASFLAQRFDGSITLLQQASPASPAPILEKSLCPILHSSHACGTTHLSHMCHPPRLFPPILTSSR